MVQEAEKYKNDDDAQRERISAKNALESYCFNMKSTVEAVRLQGILGRDTLTLSIIVVLVFLCFLYHTLDFFLEQTSLVVGDGNLVLLTSRLVHGRHIQDTVGIDVKSDLDLGNTTGCRGDSSKLELAEEIVILGHCTFTLVHLDEHTRLVVRVGGESLSLLGRNGSVPLDKGSHDTTGGLNSHG